jgi:hypothetical protein
MVLDKKNCNSKPSILTRIWKRVLRTFCGTQISKFHYLVFDTSVCPVLRESPTFKISNVNFSDFETGNKDRLTPVKVSIIKERLASKSYKCFGIIENEKLLYSTWVALDRITLPNGIVYQIKSDEAILEDSYCELEARGRHFHSVMNLYRLDYLASIGKKRVYAIVLDGNIPAMKVQFKSGFKEIKTFYSGQILWKSFSTLKQPR